jgi:predicted Zn-dependent protease
MKIAQKLDPQSAYINLFLGDMLSFARKPDEAISSYQKALEIEPTSIDVRWKLIKAYEQKGSMFAAEKQLEKILAANVMGNSAVLLVKSRILAKKNKKSEAKKILDQVISKGNLESLYFLIAQVQIALGEDNEAINSLEKVIPRIEDNIYTIKYEPNLDPIRDNKRFVSLLKEKEKEQGWL